MAAKALKPWALTEYESITSFESWKSNIEFILGLEEKFQPFLQPNVTWRRYTKNCKNRGFTGQNAATKASNLELMLGQIANFAPIISRGTIVKNSTSLTSIWEAIRLYYGILSNGGRFLDFVNIQASPEKRPEALYQEMYSFIEDNLMKNGTGIKHHDEIQDDEEVSPTLENLIVLLWLHKLNPELPRVVKERFGTELRSRTLASLRTEISQCIPSLLASIDSNESHVSFSKSHSHAQSSYRRPPTPKKQCPICKTAGKANNNHFLSECKYLPEEDRAFITKKRKPKTRSIVVDIPFSDDETEDESEENEIQERLSSPSTNRRVETKSAPQFKAFHRHNTVTVTLDTGAEVNLIRQSTAHFLGVKIKKSTQTARQADGITPLNIVGETSLSLSRDNVDLILEALVVSDIDVDILGGMPFMTLNNISLKPSRSEITLQDVVTISYNKDKPSLPHRTVRRTQAHVLKAPTATTLWPGEYMELELPALLATDDQIAVEPRNSKSDITWPCPAMCDVIGNKIRLANSSSEPVSFSKHEHFCQALPILEVEEMQSPTYSVSQACTKPVKRFSQDVSLDPDNLMSAITRRSFEDILEQHDVVFDPQFKGYNGFHGNFEAVVNMGPVSPPQRKGRVPQYSRDKLVQLQEMFDDLLLKGVFKRPEDAGIVVEYLNPSFLVKKQNGSFRLVTAFTDVGRFCKPSPSTMPDVDSTLRTIAAWRHIMVTDLTSAFYQIPLAHDSMKYCGVATPFKGTLVYQRAAMGMPGSETALEEMMCRVIGPLLQDGSVAKLADDLYCGGSTYEELASNMSRLLEALAKCDLRLSAKKTIIAPKRTTILGWIWQEGALSASPHRIATLSQAAIPSTVKGLRSFIGAYKFLGRVLPGCASIIAPLDEAISGLQGKEQLPVSDSLRDNFRKAQDHLRNHKSITLPRSDDKLWIVTDGAVRNSGIGSTLYITREGKLRLAGFFSIKLKKHHSKWLPCEVEALGIATSVNHFAPYIVQSKHQCSVLTDSKPCVQAFEKLCRGEFSHSPRVLTFLSTASRYHITIHHLAGSVNIPSDFASRNAPECITPSCQICAFAKQVDESVIRSLSISDITSGKALPPFTNRKAWLSLQSSCSDLRRTHAHLTQGTRPSKKITNARDVKRYLNIVTLSHDGLLVVKKNEPLIPTKELIVVPRVLLPGLVTAIHISLDHPSANQLKQVLDRRFFALNMSDIIKDVTDNCHICSSLRSLPRTIIPQTTSDPPLAIGTNFAADVMRQRRQFILVLRETVTSYTVTRLIESETKDSLRSALICSCLELRPLSHGFSVVRVDAAPGFTALYNDTILAEHHIKLEIGYTKNPNKNPIAERAVQELEEELLKSSESAGQISPLQLAVATARLNTRIRSCGLSSREMLLQREQLENAQIPVSDQALIDRQHNTRKKNHKYSEKSKADNPKQLPDIILPGDLVYLKGDLTKTHARERYLVLSVDADYCTVKKFHDSQIRCTTYKVKTADCILIPILKRRVTDTAESQSDTYDDVSTSNSPPVTSIPEALIAPPTDSEKVENTTDEANFEADELHPQRPKRNRKVPNHFQEYELY